MDYINLDSIASEIYDTHFSQDVDKALDELENTAGFIKEGKLYNTLVKTVRVSSLIGIPNGKVIPSYKFSFEKPIQYDRDRVIQGIKEVLANCLGQGLKEIDEKIYFFGVSVEFIQTGIIYNSTVRKWLSCQKIEVDLNNYLKDI